MTTLKLIAKNDTDMELLKFHVTVLFNYNSVTENIIVDGIIECSIQYAKKSDAIKALKNAYNIFYTFDKEILCSDISFLYFGDTKLIYNNAIAFIKNSLEYYDLNYINQFILQKAI